MKKTNIPDEVLSDEAVRFISERHHTTVSNVLDKYTALHDGNKTPGNMEVSLEDNEVQIIHDLISMYDKNI